MRKSRKLVFQAAAFVSSCESGFTKTPGFNFEVLKSQINAVVADT
jgi:hypothetical protein